MCEVASHCVSHAYLTACDPAAASIEVLDDRRALEGIFGCQVHGFAYPNGVFNDDVVAMLKINGIYYARTCVSTLKFDMPQDWLRMPAAKILSLWSWQTGFWS